MSEHTAEFDAGIPFASVTVGLCSSGHRTYVVVWPDGTAESLHEGLWPNCLNPRQREQLRAARRRGTRVTPPEVGNRE